MRALLVLLVAISSSVVADSLSSLQPFCDPYYPNIHHPRLTTPQWVGEDSVEAVVILSIDDMRDSAKYEQFLRPLLDRLKQIDGRAPVSIFANSVSPNDPQLQAWLKEGLSLETHTADHPCPLLCDGDFDKAKSTYDRCVDQLFQVPNSQPVAFRMPCCDSLNTPSPRFWSEIFSKQTTEGNFLRADSSVFNIFTSADPSLRQEWVVREDGTPRFKHYVPFTSFVNTIENYPYPYIIGDSCWEFPCVVPSDWEAQNVQQPNNPDTVKDWQTALDITVAKQGVMPIVFHPHGWIRAEQLMQFVDYAHATYGKKVKFLTFAEAVERLEENLLGGVALRNADGDARQVRLVDVNQDGLVDVFHWDETQRVTRVWNSASKSYDQTTAKHASNEYRFGLQDDVVHVLATNPSKQAMQLYRWSNQGWLPVAWENPDGSINPKTAVIFFHDFDHDGNSELFVSHQDHCEIFEWSQNKFRKRSFDVPVTFTTSQGQRAPSVRWVDINQDGLDDIVQASASHRQVWLCSGTEHGWRSVDHDQPSLAEALPAFTAADNTDNGAWFHSGHVWVQNEHTARLPDLVDRTPFSALGTASDSSTEHPLGRAKTLSDSLATFTKLPGHRLEVVASEPQIADPVAFDWGPQGELWVAEMGDYPNGAQWHGPGDPKGDPGGRIKLLFDRDGDGRYETAYCFLDGLTVPTAVKAYRNGVLICAAPQILYAEDTDGDHVADKQEVLYEGLREGNQQHRANGLRWGLDHWIHIANGDSGGKLRSAATGDVVDIGGRDVRIHPSNGRLELTSGQTQFGRSRDNHGNWFGGSNSEPAWHYVLDEKFQSRNKFLRHMSPRNIISATPGAAPVFPTSQTVERFNDFDRADRFTSACSTEVSRSDAAVTAFIYVCEPVHNLVHRAELSANGPSFRSRRAAGEETREFLTSTDNWFRPVMVRYGPDDAIWVADMYRQVIEHPEWIPMDWQTRIDHLGGNDRGRIYRVVSVDGGAQERVWHKLRKMSIQELVAALDNENGVLRDMVQQELFERQDPESLPLLKQLHRSAVCKNARIPIGYLLRDLEGLDASFLKSAIDENRFDVHLLQAALPQFQTASELRQQLDAWLASAKLSPGDAIRAGYALGELKSRGASLARLLRFHHDDQWVSKALMSSVSEDSLLAMFQEFWRVTTEEGHSFAERPVFHDLVAYTIGTQHKPTLAFFISEFNALTEQAQMSVLSVLLQEFQRQDKHPTDVLADDQISTIYASIDVARNLLESNAGSVEQRLQCLAALGIDPNESLRDSNVLASLLGPTTPTELQKVAIRKIRRLGVAKSAGHVLNRWSQLSPVLRDHVVREALSEESWTEALLNSIEQGKILTREIGMHLQARLLEHRKPSIRERATSLLETIPSDREGLVQDYLEQTSDEPSVAKGKQWFNRQCNSCHQLEGQGRAVGPDLTALSDRSRAALLTAILDPNKAVEDKYLNYSIVLQTGEAFQGLLAQEAAHSITLATAEGEHKEILRDQIELMQCLGKSLMPEGLERGLDADAMNDLIHYVQSVKTKPKQFPGNAPQIAPVRDDGSLRMFAMHAEIYGPNLVFESQYRNLGFWSSESDYAVWTIHPKQAGRYAFNLDYACPDESAGNRFQLRVNGRKLSETVESSGSWDRYRSQHIGTLWLPGEPVQVSVSSEGPVNGFLFDLRTIVLWPED